MFRFNTRSRDLDLPALDLRLVDFLGLPEDRRKRVIAEFDADFGGRFLKRNFPDEELCRSSACLTPVIDAYKRARDGWIAAGEPVITVEEWSRDNGAGLTADHVTLPHEGARWFELRSIETRLRVGALQISRINLVNIVDKTAHLCGHAIMTLPRHPTLTYAEYWGEVLKALIDEPFVAFADPTQTASFEEWVLPKSLEARYVARSGNTFGADVMRRASVDTIVELGDVDVEHAPLNIRKRPRTAALTAQALAPMIEAVVKVS